MVNPSSNKSNPRKSLAPLKVLSVEGLKKALRFVQKFYKLWMALQFESFNQ